jgi:hypothetical protein
MSDNIVPIVVAIVAFVLLTAILTLRSKKKYAEQWSGSVTEVRRYESGGNEGTPQSRVKLKWKRDNGSSGSLDLDEATFDKLYAGLKQGDRLCKKTGEGMPVRE